jgi:hypothetical protein
MFLRIGLYWKLCVFISPTTTWVTFALFHPPHRSYKTSWSYSRILPFVPKQMHRANLKDMVFIRPPGISDGVFQLRIDNIWSCNLMLLFKINAMKDDGIKQLDCAYFPVLEEYKSPLKSGHLLHILHILHMSHHLMCCSSQFGSILKCQSAIVYERCEQSQVLYAIPVSSILLGRHPLVPVGWTRTIPFEMQRESEDFPGDVCDKTNDSGNGTVVDGVM